MAVPPRMVQRNLIGVEIRRLPLGEYREGDPKQRSICNQGLCLPQIPARCNIILRSLTRGMIFKMSISSTYTFWNSYVYFGYYLSGVSFRPDLYFIVISFHLIFFCFLCIWFPLKCFLEFLFLMIYIIYFMSISYLDSFRILLFFKVFFLLST